MAATAAIGGGWYGWHVWASRLPDPPTATIEGVADPEVLEAIEAARQRVLAEPRSAAAWGELGMCFAAHGFEAEAEYCFAAAERLDSSNPRWPYFRARFFAVQGERDETIPRLRRALALNPQPEDARLAIRLLLAEKLAERRAFDEAAAICNEELGRYPTNARAQFIRGELAMARDDRETARKAFLAAAESPQARKRATIQLAALARASGDATAGGYEEAIKRFPNDEDWPDPYLETLERRRVGLQTLQMQVTELEKQGRFQEAIALLERIVRTTPRPEFLTLIAVDLAKVQAHREAERYLRQSLSLDATHPQTNYYMCYVLFEQAQLPGRDRKSMLEEAVRYGRIAVEFKPDHGPAWWYLGRSLLGLGKIPEAVQALQEAVACRPEIVDPHLHLAEALLAAGDRGAARREASDAAKLAQPHDKRPRELLEKIGP